VRKSKRLPPPPVSFSLLEVLPELALALRHGLRKHGYRELSDKLAELRIYGRCECGRPCGTFYCPSAEERQRLFRHGEWIDGDVFFVAQGRILEIQTLDKNVDAVLVELFPRLLSDD